MVLSTTMTVLWYIFAAAGVMLIFSSIAAMLNFDGSFGYTYDDLRAQLFTGLLIVFYLFRSVLVP